MGRYYSIEIGAETGPQTGGQAASNNAGAVFTNLVNGAMDLGGPQVEIQVQSTVMNTPVGDSIVIISGVSLKQIAQASDFNGAPITVKAGMQKGLPLASAEALNQAGVIVQGTVFQAYGNWLGVNQTLNLVIKAGGGEATQDDPKNFTWNWTKGQPMADAIKATLSAALPTYKLNINISANLVFTQDDTGYHQTLQQFSSHLYDLSLLILGQGDNNTYSGVQVTTSQMAINVHDSTWTPTPTQLNPADLIGQPTWLGIAKVSFNTVMRADLAVGDFITFPTVSVLQTTTTPGSQSQARDKSTFAGNWQIVYVMHVGNSRGPNAQDWISTFQAISVSAPSGVDANTSSD